MKRLLAFFLVILFVLGLVGCGNGDRTFTGKVLHINEKEKYVFVRPSQNSKEAEMVNWIRIKVEDDEIVGALQIGDDLKIKYDGVLNGNIREAWIVNLYDVKIVTSSEGPQPEVNTLYEKYEIQTFEIYFKGDESNKAFIEDSLNADKWHEENLNYCPIFKLDTPEDAEQFIAKYSETIELDRVWYGGDISFIDAIPKYDAEFFENNSLLLIHASSPCMNYQFGIRDIVIKKSNCTVYIEQTNFSLYGLSATIDYMFMIAIPKDDIASCTEFDAVFRGVFNR